jgi:hypothetical protein
MTTPSNPNIVQDFLNGLSSPEREGNDPPVVYSQEQMDPTSLVALEELLHQCPPSSLPSISLTPGEQLILSHIQQQSRMIHPLQERIDRLEKMLLSLRYESDTSGSSRDHAVRPQSASVPRIFQKRSSDSAAAATIEAPTRAPPPMLRWRRDLIKLRLCGTLYVELLRRYQEQQRQRNNNPPNIDPLFLLKVLIMLAILMSRLPPHLTGIHKDGSQNADQEFMYQYVVVSILIITFFMIRSGRYTFFYHFLWKYNIPRRVWSQPAGTEPLTADALWREHWAPAAPIPAPGGGAVPVHQRVLQWWLLHDWFQGRPLPPRDPAAPPPPRGVLQQSLLLLQDVLVFLVSFVLSIFPMWRNLDLQALFPAPRDGPGNHGNPAPGADGMPVLEPPRDPAANDDEDDDEEEDGEEE